MKFIKLDNDGLINIDALLHLNALELFFLPGVKQKNKSKWHNNYNIVIIFQYFNFTYFMLSYICDIKYFCWCKNRTQLKCTKLNTT